MSLNAIDYFAKYIEKETGIVFHEVNRYQLKSRLEEIVKQENLTSIDELAGKFLTGAGPSSVLKDRLLDHATNNETLFFRDPGFFKAIENFILTEVLLDCPKEIKIWSAASSTGQEALSVAMTLDELSRKVTLPPFKIVATDISHKALLKARSGAYTDFEIRRGLDDEKKAKYFTKEGDLWKVKPQLHSKISFSYNNLIRSSVNDTFHIILCRNVLIYQTIDVKKYVVDRLFHQLDTTGGLLLGVGETLLGVRERVQTTMVGNVIFYRKTSDSLLEAV